LKDDHLSAALGLIDVAKRDAPVKKRFQAAIMADKDNGGSSRFGKRKENLDELLAMIRVQ
jgi:hypothetical protein